MTVLPFVLPYIRWADIIDLTGSGTPTRRIFDHEFVLCLAGHGDIVIEGVKHPAAPNRLFLIQPRQWHAYQPAGGALTVLGVHFDWTPQHDTLRFPIFRPAPDAHLDESWFRTPREVPNWDLRLQPYLDLGSRSRVPRLLDNVVAEYALADDQSHASAGALLAAAIAQMAREAHLRRMQQASEEIGADALRRVQRARAALEQTAGLKSIEEVAGEVGWSGDHLRRMFRRALGTSPGAVQMAARMRLARSLLRAGKIPVAEVARECGFPDPSHFARVFKQETGLTPREFQSMALKN